MARQLAVLALVAAACVARPTGPRAHQLVRHKATAYGRSAAAAPAEDLEDLSAALRGGGSSAAELEKAAEMRGAVVRTARRRRPSRARNEARDRNRSLRRR